MIEHVVAALRAAGLDPAWDDVADTLWLAAQLGRDQQLQAPVEPLPGQALAGEALPGQAGTPGPGRTRRMQARRGRRRTLRRGALTARTVVNRGRQ